ncbi:MAG: host attachment protein [Gammaproteobacteria bacterium]
MNIWFLVADAARARIFETTGKSVALTEIMDFTEPHARIDETLLASDEPGRQATAGGPGTHGMQEKITPREQEDIRFAAELAGQLQESLNEGSFDELYITAAPHFEEEIRQHLHEMM